MKELREHQHTAISMLRRSFSLGRRRPILQLATGAGKTVIAATIFRNARERNRNVRLLFIVDAISLVDQTVQAFYEQGLHSIGVIQGNHVMQDWSKPIQVASVQTLQRRQMFKADIVIVDECHRQNAWLHELMAQEEWAEVPFIGLSATPWSKGLGNVYDDLLIPVTMQDLIEAGYLSPFKAFAAAHPDLGAIKTVAGDYHEGQLSGVMSDGALVADIVDTWKRLGDNRPTFAFCVDRAHAKKVQRRFEEGGVPCGYIDAYTEAHERHAVRRQLEAGEIKVVANVACLTTGVDWPIGCVILARPTKSEMLYVQMVGRGLRVNEGMPDCIILDHADNTLRLGFVTDIQHLELCTAKKGERTIRERKEALPKECPSCTYLKPPKVHECPSCGFKPERRSQLEEEAGELVQITKAKLDTSKAEKQRWYSELLGLARERSYSHGWASQTYRKRFGVWPRGLIERSSIASPEVRRFAKHCIIAFVKARGSAAA
jgi:DNA repair protein RadD